MKILNLSKLLAFMSNKYLGLPYLLKRSKILEEQRKRLSFSSFKMVNIRQFLITQRPVYYEVCDKDGEMVMGFYHEMYLEKYLGKDGFQIKLCDIDKEIRQLDGSLERLEVERRELAGEIFTNSILISQMKLLSKK